MFLEGVWFFLGWIGVDYLVVLVFFLVFLVGFFLLFWFFMLRSLILKISILLGLMLLLVFCLLQFSLGGRNSFYLLLIFIIGSVFCQLGIMCFRLNIVGLLCLMELLNMVLLCSMFLQCIFMVFFRVGDWVFFLLDFSIWYCRLLLVILMLFLLVFFFRKVWFFFRFVWVCFFIFFWWVFIMWVWQLWISWFMFVFLLRWDFGLLLKLLCRLVIIVFRFRFFMVFICLVLWKFSVQDVFWFLVLSFMLVFLFFFLL